MTPVSAINGVPAAIDGVPSDDRVPNDATDWTDGVGDQTPGARYGRRHMLR